MAHHVYTTLGFIIDSENTREANKTYSIFTKELGMIRATAQSVRLLKSKLRFSLQDFSYTTVSVVRGKDVWRLTSAKIEWNVFTLYNKKSTQHILYVIAHMFVVLKRLIPGEGKNEALFDLLVDAFTFLDIHAEMLTEEEVKSFERIAVLNILKELGYTGDMGNLSTFIIDTHKKNIWTRDSMREMIPLQKKATEEINRSLRESQL